jgi:phosphoribosylglycinamide formyltransferase-1
MSKLRAGILISGRGSNMKALIEAARAPDYPAEIACVVANRADAAGLAYARHSGIETTVIDHRAFPTREAFDQALDAHFRSRRLDIVALAGFMRILTPALVDSWQGRMLNIHPSLLPAYRGLETHARALAAGEKVHGCTVHIVSADLDSGPILLQAEVPILPGDTSETLAARVLKEEHRIYPEALAILARELQAKTST